MAEIQRLNNEVILRASQGDPEAMEAVLEFYMPYINTAATGSVFGSDGHWHTWLDEDRRSFLITHLIEAILKWRILP